MHTVAVLGATGAVGVEILRMLERRAFPAHEVRLLASPRSAGRKVAFRGKLLTVEPVSEKAFEGVHIGLFSAGGDVSREWAPVAARQGAVVIDNTSAFRMEPDVPLVVPEVNIHAIETLPARRIIANPNCSTIQMVVVLAPLAREAGLERIVVSTYQSTSGKGAAAMMELRTQTREVLDGHPAAPKVFPHPIAFNCLPHIDSFTPSGYTKEELKMANETRKIMELPAVRVSATCVRVPVFRSHSESVNAEFRTPIDPIRAREILHKAPGVVVVDDPLRNDYPMPVYAEGHLDTFVGRIRQDPSIPDGRGLDMWIVSDNLLKGAAWNAVQIAEWLVKERKV